MVLHLQVGRVTVNAAINQINICIHLFWNLPNRPIQIPNSMSVLRVHNGAFFSFWCVWLLAFCFRGSQRDLGFASIRRRCRPRNLRWIQKLIPRNEHTFLFRLDDELYKEQVSFFLSPVPSPYYSQGFYL